MSMSHYNLSCSQLTVGDVCISLRHTAPPSSYSATPDITADPRPKQVRFQDSPLPLKKKRVSSISELSSSSTTDPAAGPPVSISFRVSSVSDPLVTMTSEQTIS